MPMRLSSFLLLTLLLITSGCSFLPDQIDETSEWSANQLYARAKQELSQQNYEKAIDYFEKLEARFPFGQYAQQAQLEIAYAYYKFEEPELAITAADRFIKIYPRHPNVDYAWYIKGLTNYNRGKVFIDRYLPQEPAERDTFSMRQSYDDFSQLVQRYPNSTYAKDAAQRMIHLRNNMAEYEIHVADYYMRRTAYVAAANRGKYVVENFQRTPAVEDALVIMVRAFRKLKVHNLADGAMRVLQLNYPDNSEIAFLNDPRGYEAAKNSTVNWGGWKSWKSDDKNAAGTAVKEVDKPVYWGNWKPWRSDAEKTKKTDKAQEPALWEDWQQQKPSSDEVETAVEPVTAPQPETTQEPAHWGGWKPWKPDSPDAKETAEKPGLLENWKFWKQDKTDTPDANTQQEPSLWEDWQQPTQGTEAPKTNIEEQQPPFWNDWKFWDKKTATPAEENSEAQPGYWDKMKSKWKAFSGSTPEPEDSKEQPGYWERLKSKVKQYSGSTSSTEDRAAQPGYREKSKLKQDNPATGNGAGGQEPSLWEEWQHQKPATEDTGTASTTSAPRKAVKESATKGVFTPWKSWNPGAAETDTAAEIENTGKGPGFWERVKFWEKDSRATETPTNEEGEAKPSTWERLKFWEKTPEEVPAAK